MKPNKTIMLLGTGGTIAGTAKHIGANVGYTAAQLGVEQLLATVPDLPCETGAASIVAEQIIQVDSKDMTHAHWACIATRCAALLAQEHVTGIVITHGSDTLEETAWVLANLLPADKAVVLTCAMRPATALAADGPQNLLDALRLAAQPDARGVLVLVAGTIHSAHAVTKMHPLRLDAFDCGDAGPLGWVEAGRVRWAHGKTPIAQAPTWGALLPLLAQQPWPRVDIVISHAGANGDLVDWMVQGGVQGIVVAATGNGTLHTALEQALTRAADANVCITITSRCPHGSMLVLPGAWPDARWQVAKSSSAVKARIDLLLQLLAQSLSVIPTASISS